MKSQPKKEVSSRDIKTAHGNSSKHSSAKSSGRGAPMSSRDKEAAAKREENEKLLVKAKQIYLGLDDLARLPELNEEELLLAMETRYKSDKIFSFVGPNLAVVNPFKMIDSLFSAEKLKLFQDAVRNNINPATLEPHIFGIAAVAMQQAQEGKRKQAIVISGESGAGKTENTKFAIQFLTQLQSSENQNDLYSDESSMNMRDSWARVSYRSQLSIEQRILACNPILESFGNAKTARNDNSSRFGKLIKLNLKCTESAQQAPGKGPSIGIQSGSIQSYLLEKSRIVKLSGDERNYHAFYQLIQGLDMSVLEQLGLPWKSSGAYRYLRSKVETANGIDDSEWFLQVNSCFEELGFTESEKNSVWEILASILLLGNIDFEQSNENQPAVIVRSQKTLADAVCKRLQCSQEALLLALTTKTIQVGTSILMSPITTSECNSNRDSLSKYLYDRLFSWLVFKLNHFIGGSNSSGSDQPHNQPTNVIEILDIFGFEAFEKNGFEQLCINFANERLQQLYISYIFRGESLLFAAEGLSNFLSEIKFSDNQPIIQALEFSKEPIGVFNLLDEASAIKTADDQTFLASVLKQHIPKTTKQNSKNTDANASPGIISFSPLQQQQFTVKHSIGSVIYSVEGFRNKNKDEVSLQIQQLPQHKTIKSIIHFDKDSKDINVNGENNTNTNARDSNNNVVNKSNDKFISAKFRGQMRQLMEELSGCECQFVRCVKPNMQKQPLFFTKNYVLNQVNCLGLLETIRVRKEGYMYRADYIKFLQSYSLLAMTQNLKSQDQDQLKAIAVQLITKAGILTSSNDRSVLFGKTMIFLKETAFEALSQQLKRKEIELKAAGLVIARAYRCYQIRSWLKKIKRVKRFLVCLLYRFRFVKSDVVSKMREARKLKEKELKQHKSIITIRKLFQVLVMKRRLKRLSAARRIQLWYINRKRQEFIKKKLAITKKYIKSKLQMINDRRAFLKIRKAITIIQRAFRRVKFRREIHARIMVLSVLNRAVDQSWEKIINHAATKINSLVRMYICKCHNYEIVLQGRKAAAITRKISSAKRIQFAWRYYQFRQAMGGYRTAAETIQSYYKMIQPRSRYRNIRGAALIIQAQVRNYLYTKQYLLKQWAGYPWEEVFQSQIERENGLAMLNIPYCRRKKRRTSSLMTELWKEKMKIYYKERQQSELFYAERRTEGKGKRNTFVEGQDNGGSVTDYREQLIVERFISIDDDQEEKEDDKRQDKLGFDQNKIQNQRSAGYNVAPSSIKEYYSSLSGDDSELIINTSSCGNSNQISNQHVRMGDFQENPILYRLCDEKVKLHCVILDLDAIDGCSNEIYSQESWPESYLKATKNANKRGSVVTTILVGESYTALVTDNSQVFTFGQLACDTDMNQQVKYQQRSEKQHEESAFVKQQQLSPIQHFQSVPQTNHVLADPNHQSLTSNYQYQSAQQDSKPSSLSLSLQDALVSLKTNLHSTKVQARQDEMMIISRNVSLFSPGIVRKSPSKIASQAGYSFSNQKDNRNLSRNSQTNNLKQEYESLSSPVVTAFSIGSDAVDKSIGCVQSHEQLKQIIRCDGCCDSIFFQTSKNEEWHVLGENHLDFKLGLQQQNIERQRSEYTPVFPEPTVMDKIQFTSIHQQASTHSTIIVERNNCSLMDDTKSNNQTPWICEIQTKNKQSSVNRFHFNQSITSVTCGGSFSLLLNNQGLVYAFGENLGGQLGLSHNVSPINKPTLIPFFAAQGEAIRSVSAGLKHSLAVSARGKLFAWGSNQVGQLGLGHFNSINIPTQVENKIPCSFVCARAALKSSVALTQHRQLVMWGTNSCVNKQPLPIEISLEKYAADPDHAKRNWAIVKLGSAWSKNISVFYAIVVDMAAAKSAMRQSLLKQASILARDWLQHEVTPPESLRLQKETNKIWRDKNEQV